MCARPILFILSINLSLYYKLAKDAVDVLLQQLQTVIDEQNSGKAKEIMEMKDMMAILEQQLAQLIKSGKS